MRAAGTYRFLCGSAVGTKGQIAAPQAPASHLTVAEGTGTQVLASGPSSASRFVPANVVAKGWLGKIGSGIANLERCIAG